MLLTMASERVYIFCFVLLLNFHIYYSSQSDTFPVEKVDQVYKMQLNVKKNCAFNCYCDDLVIDCSFKNLNVFPLDLHSSVFHLNLVGNKLSRLTFNSSLKALNSLNVSKNNITQIDYEWINSLGKLKYLDLSNNELISKEIEKKFRNISLLHLDLSNNQLNYLTNTMFSHLSSLLSLNLSYNVIENATYNAFWDLTKLNILDLSFNQIIDVPHDWFLSAVNLQKLYMKQNKIRFLKNVLFSTLKNLQVLDLSGNKIQSVGLLSFKGLLHLKYLNMSRNDISQLQEGVFRSLESLEVLDLSQNCIVNMDNTLSNARNLRRLLLRNLSNFKELTEFSLVGAKLLNYLDLSGSKALSSISIKAFYQVRNLKVLDLSKTNLTNIKMGTFNHVDKIEILRLSENPWQCDCYMFWFLVWLGFHANTHLLSPSETCCSTPFELKGEVLLDALDHSMVCINASIQKFANQTKFKVGASAVLECKVQGNPLPTIRWITPQQEAFYWNGFENKSKIDPSISLSTTENLQSDLEDKKRRFYVTERGDLAIKNVERGDGGFYVCIASNPLNYDSISIRLTLDYEYLVHIKIVSILVGLATSFGFLLLTLVAILTKMILKHFGVKCPCRNGSASPRTQQIKKILESMEHYKKQQLDRLRDNYNGQVQKIKDNCMQQIKSLRESYSSQAELLRDIKEYGTLQIDRIRENYYSQVTRVRDYSASQIIRLRENYLYQRNRIRKFSAHHLYKLRENYKVQQQHFNRILENFNIESCRTVCHRTDSVVFEPDITFDVLVPKICLQTLEKEPCDSCDNSSQLSAYFTPDEAGSEISGHESDDRESFDKAANIKVIEIDVISKEDTNSTEKFSLS